MAGRPGVAASAAAAVIFSIIIVSNLALFAGAHNRARLQYQSDAEDSLVDTSSALTSTAAVNILVETASFLSSRTFDCSSAFSATAPELAGLGGVLQEGDVSVEVSSVQATPSIAQDNLSALRPFNGSTAGEFDLTFRTVVSGADPSAGVSISKEETHYVHLQVRLEDMVVLCIDGVSSILGGLTTADLKNCSYSSVRQVIVTAGARSTSLADYEGYQFGIDFSVTGTNPCTVEFVVSVTQFDAVGPAGAFTVNLQSEARATFG